MYLIIRDLIPKFYSKCDILQEKHQVDRTNRHQDSVSWLFLLTLLGMYLFICFNAIGGIGSLGNKSFRRCSMPMARNSEMKLLSVMF